MRYGVCGGKLGVIVIGSVSVEMRSPDSPQIRKRSRRLIEKSSRLEIYPPSLYISWLYYGLSDVVMFIMLKFYLGNLESRLSPHFYF
jgi:hypothetical protein